MDRTLKVYAKSGHLFAVFKFEYDNRNQAGGVYTMYRRLYNDDEEDEDKRVFELATLSIYPHYRKFDSIEQIKEHDKQFVKQNLGHEMENPESYNYVYEEQPVLYRCIVENHRGFVGMVNIIFSFINNTKEVKFLSGSEPRFDFDLTSDSLESNLECMMRIPVYTDRNIEEIRPNELRRLPEWY